MQALSVQQSVELFHLLLLSFLGKKTDKSRYALKGGCNLRFFFGSPRYSEDMDIDVANVPVHVVQDTVGGILDSNPFRQALRVYRVDVEHVTEHKQSETTQRWKLGLLTPGTAQVVPTKVEFSRRGLRGGAVLGSVSPTLVQGYGLPPIMAPHYPGDVALLQKIEALATRSVPQARDIFDLHLLLSRERAQAIGSLKPDVKEAARLRSLDLSFDDFKGQVLAYLDPNDRAAYDSPAAWDAMQLSVLEMLEDAT
ncbi:MAG: hypothetical protein A3K19_09355 [Lentisphaerae bacterium RIFOXYB12_FULL_65_16]|nr:MAG: hypothetical protein A3K18_22370 [Lentisphaerae bacterium RIFOXYA12_64_32]OGV90401.1 MAG: hypothetical protein A3K19_09355 [Lentisphaerae bacterium RIFOXYB12_FULL_65_16]